MTQNAPAQKDRHMPRTLFAAAALALTTALPVQATDLSDLSDAERQAFRDEVRAYLLENPEVLMEAIAVLEDRQAEQQVANDASLVRVNAQDIFSDPHSWVGGNPEGDVTLVEFMDYRCSYCRRAFDDVEALIDGDQNIRLVIKEFPILGEQSELASRFAISVKAHHGDEAYKSVHDTLIKFRGNITMTSLDTVAARLDLDMDAITPLMTSDATNDIIRQNRQLAQRLGISGTPTFVLDEQMLRGYVPLDGMQQIVADVRAN